VDRGGDALSYTGPDRAADEGGKEDDSEPAAEPGRGALILEGRWVLRPFLDLVFHD
jgi:hypothetical protein